MPRRLILGAGNVVFGSRPPPSPAVGGDWACSRPSCRSNLALVRHLEQGLLAAMYAVLLAGSVPAPLVAGWLADRVGHKPMLVVTYLGGALALVIFVLAGSSVPLLWAGIVLLAIFNFAESPQLQALLADIVPARTRDVAFSAYFTLAFGVGSLWIAGYGAVIALLGDIAGFPTVFALMAGASWRRRSASSRSAPEPGVMSPAPRTRGRSRRRTWLRPSATRAAEAPGLLGAPEGRCYTRAFSVGAWLSLVERSVRDAEAAGSNPAAPTTPSPTARRRHWNGHVTEQVFYNGL